MFNELKKGIEATIKNRTAWQKGLNKSNKSLRTEKLVNINKSMYKLNSRTEMIEGKVSEVEDSSKEITQNALREIKKKESIKMS